MSLQVWLPLTKDLRNQGLANVTVTNNGATYSSTGGKLGGAYTLTNGPITLSNLPNPTAISVSFWFKRTADTGTRQFMFTAWNGVTCELTTSGAPTFAVYRNNYPTITGPNNITVSSGWVHYCGTFSTTEGMKLYINGSLVASNSTTTAISWNTTTGQIGKYSTYASMSAIMNDFRIYNHALSQMEVKKLSQGLVLHYPLNRNGWGQENLLLNSGVFTSTSGWTNNQNTTLSVEDNELKVIINQTSSTPGIKVATSFSLVAGTYTASLLIKVENGNKNYVNYPFYMATSGGTALYGGSYIKKENKGDYVYEEATFSLASDVDNVIFYILTSGPANGETWHLKWVKLEKGSVATPWCPNSVDTLATTLGLNSTIERDYSGYGNNGTRTGTFSWTSDGPKYKVTSVLANSNHLSTTALSLVNPTQLTAACWGKPANANLNNLFACSYTGDYWQIVTSYSNTLEIRDSATGQTGTRKSYNMPSITAEEWVHLVVTYDAGTVKIYKNGILQSTNITGGTNLNTLNLWRVGNSQSNLFNGIVSDFRIYATALSAKDILSLYNNGAYIDDNNKIYGEIR